MTNQLKPSTTYRAILGRVLAHERSAAGKDQREVAVILGMSQSAWSRVETGQSGLTVDQLSRVATILDVQADTLLRKVQQSIAYLERRGVLVLMPSDEEANAAAAVLGIAALAGLIATAMKK